EIRRRVEDAGELSGAWVVGPRGDAPRELAARVEVPGALVESRQARPLVGIGHHHEVPALRVGAGRRLERALDAALDQLRLDRATEVEALADRPGRGEPPLGGIEVDCHVAADAADGGRAAALSLEAWRPVLQARPDAIFYPTVGFGLTIEERYAHVPILVEAGVLRMGLVDPGSVNLGEIAYVNTAGDI